MGGRRPAPCAAYMAVSSYWLLMHSAVLNEILDAWIDLILITTRVVEW